MKTLARTFSSLSLSLLTAFGAMASAQAEVKPANTILDTYCGNLNRSVQVCVSHNTTTGKAFIKVAVFNQKPEYLVVQRQGNVGAGAAARQEFFASRVVFGAESQVGMPAGQRGYPIEQLIKLTVGGSAPAQPRLTGVLEVAGQAGSARSFEMQTVFHTM